jgi:hypothetical protein
VTIDDGVIASITGGLRECGRGHNFVVARNEHVIVILLWSAITDDVNHAWRTVTQRSYDSEGYPPFGFVHATNGQSVGTLQGKMRSAAFMRASSQRMKRIALVADVVGSFVVKSVMRVAGASNVELVTPSSAPAILDEMKRGVDPFA